MSAPAYLLYTAPARGCERPRVYGAYLDLQSAGNHGLHTKFWVCWLFFSYFGDPHSALMLSDYQSKLKVRRLSRRLGSSVRRTRHGCRNIGFSPGDKYHCLSEGYDAPDGAAGTQTIFITAYTETQSPHLYCHADTDRDRPSSA